MVETHEVQDRRVSIVQARLPSPLKALGIRRMNPLGKVRRETPKFFEVPCVDDVRSNLASALKKESVVYAPANNSRLSHSLQRCVVVVCIQTDNCQALLDFLHKHYRHFRRDCRFHGKARHNGIEFRQRVRSAKCGFF